MPNNFPEGVEVDILHRLPPPPFPPRQSPHQINICTDMIPEKKLVYSHPVGTY